MAFADYLDLKLAVGELTGRRDLSEVMPTLVKMAETRLNRDLRFVDQLTTVTIAMVDGVGTLPTDFAEAARVYSGYSTYLQNRSDQAPQGHCQTYSVSGTQLRLEGYSGNLSLEYWAKLPTLTASPTTTNWLLEKGSDLYLFAVSREVARHIRDAEMRMTMETEYKDALIELKVANRRYEWGDARVQVEGATP